MKPDELAEELGRGELRPAYLLAGGEALLRDDALEGILGAVFGDSARDFDLDRLDGVSLKPGVLVDSLRSLPVVAPRRVVVLRNPEGRRGSSAPLLEALAAAVEELRERDDVVLVVTAEKCDKRTRWVKAFAKPAARVECDPPKGGRALAGFVAAEARRQGVKLGPGAAEALAERIGPQLLLLRHEIEKAALYAGPGNAVTRDHVAATSCDVAEEPVWDLTDAIGEGRLGDAVKLLRRMLGAGVPAPVLLGTLASHFRKLARLRSGGQVAGHPFAIQKLERQARRQSALRLRRGLQTIHDADESLKGRGELPPDLVLEQLVMGLSG